MRDIHYFYSMIKNSNLKSIIKISYEKKNVIWLLLSNFVKIFEKKNSN